MGEPFLYIHADDYGMTKETCERILECEEKGILNSVSIMPNGCLSYAVSRLKGRDLICAVHLNLVEGRALTPIGQASRLTRPDGYMKYSFFGLLLHSFLPGRKKLRAQVQEEIRRQLQTVTDRLPKGTEICLDSHQHTHMIPMVFRAMAEVVAEEGLSLRYLRFPAEPFWPFLKCPSLYKTYSPVNIIKQIVLNVLGFFLKRDMKKTGIPSALFCGILFSGHMDKKRVEAVFPHYYKLAKKRGMDLEFLFHPGYIKKGENFMDPFKDSFNQFYLSEGRRVENQALKELKFTPFP